MKKLCMIIAMLTLAMTVSAHVVFLNLRSDGETKPWAHLWGTSNGDEHAWGAAAEQMKLVATGDGNYVYANVYTYPRNNAKFYTKSGSNTTDISGNLSFSGNTPWFKKENGQNVNAASGSAAIKLVSNLGGEWADIELKYVSGGKFETAAMAVDKSDAEYVVSVAGLSNTAYTKATGLTAEIKDGALKATLSAGGDRNGKINLHGVYKFVFDIADMSLTAVKTSELQTGSDMDVTRSWTETEFYHSVLPLLLTPTSNVKSWSVAINSGSRRSFSGNAPQTIELGKGDNYGTTYTIDVTLTDAEGKNQTKRFTYKKNVDLAKWVTNGNYYYFYGDMNFWSILGVENRDGVNHRYQDPTTGEGMKIEEVYREAGNMAADNPHRQDRYGSMQEMIENWRFQPVGAASNLPAGITGSDRTDNWLVFDLSKVTHVDRSHADGHLCGQFKIVPGFLDASGTKVAYGLNGAIAPNTLYQSATNNTAGANFSLKRNVYQNAKIYFNPSTVKVYIETTTKDNTGANVETADLSGDIYLYYWNKTTNQRPASITINQGSQYNYSTESTTYLTPGNMVQVPAGTTFTSNGQQYTSNGNIYRIRLPHSTEHRSPLAFTATITSQSGASVEREIRCEDIWLVEGEEAAVSFAVASCDESVCHTKVTYSLKAPKYVNNQLVGYEYVFENVTMQWDAEQGKFVGNRNIPAQYLSGSIVEFRNAFGETVEVDVNGQETVEGNFNCETGETELLYTHLKGSYVLGNQHGLQIEAEMFEDENTINTSYSDVDYTFYVYDYLGKEVLKSGPSTAPFCEWTPAEAGYYNIKVECENKITGATAVGYDVYPVYEAAAKAAAPVQDKAAGMMTIYFDNSEVNWSTIKIYYWGGDSAPSDFGSAPAMTKVAGSIYEASIPANTTGIIFHNGSGWQTDNIDNGNVIANQCYKKSANGNGYTKVGEFAKVTIYFDNSVAKYSPMYAYVWDKDNDSNKPCGAWGGETMTKVTGDIYKVTFAHYKGATWQAIFHGNNGSQTDDITLTDGHLYKVTSTTNNSQGHYPCSDQGVYGQQQTVATPTFNPASGAKFTGSGSVTISCSTSGATIQYSLDNGSTWTNGSTVTFSTVGTHTLKARASKSGMTTSDVASATYTVEASAPDPVTVEYTFYFDNSSSKWSNPMAYVWDEESSNKEYLGNYGGTAMTSTGKDNLYKISFTYTGTTASGLKVIFNDNGATSGKKTENLNLVNGHVYKADGTHSEYVDIPDIPDPEKLIPQNPNPEFYLSEMEDLGGGELTVGGSSWGKYHTHLSLTAEEGAHQTGVHRSVNYSWAKFEDWISGTSSYDDIVSGGKTKAEWSDNHLVSGNTEPHHYCMNWHPAYYRVYKTSETENLRTAVSGSQGNVHRTHATRVARTVPVTKVSGTTTGVEDIATDNVQDSSAPVEYYNINGQKVSGESLVPGVYIRRQGNTATKVYVK